MSNTTGTVTTDIIPAGTVQTDDPNSVEFFDIQTYQPLTAHFISNQIQFSQDQKPEFLPFLQTDEFNVLTFYGMSILSFYFHLKTEEINPEISNGKYDKFFIKNSGYIGNLSLEHGNNETILWEGPWIMENAVILNEKGNISRVTCTVSKRILQNTRQVDLNASIK